MHQSIFFFNMKKKKNSLLKENIKQTSFITTAQILPKTEKLYGMYTK